MRLWHDTIPHSGVIMISPSDITNWMNIEKRAEKDYSGNGSGKYMSPFSAKLASQQHDIRRMSEGFSSFDSDYY